MSEHFTVIGPPGTGKTRYLTDQIALAVDKYGPDGVAVASLTRAAAAEIASRAKCNSENVGTLHALCFRMLGHPTVVDDTLDKFAALGPQNGGRFLTPTKNTVDDRGEDVPDSAAADDIHRQRYDFYRARCYPRELWRVSTVRFANDFENWKANTGTVDFTDMIEKVLAAQMGPPNKPGAIFYDEAQDGSRLELGLIKFWASFVEQAIIAGDPQQALYTWRGAGVEDFLAWSAKKIPLRQSYRLPRAVLEYAEAWGRQLTQRYEPRDFSPTPEIGAVELSEYTLDEPEEYFPQVEEWLSKGESVMVLASCAYMLSSVQGLLKEIGLPFHNPYKLNRLGFNPLLVSHGKSACERIFAFRRLADDNRVWSWADLFAWTEHLDAKALPYGSKAFISQTRDKAQPPTYNELSSLLGPETLGAAMAGDINWLFNRTHAKQAKAMKFPITVIRQRGIKTLRDHLDNVQSKPGRGLMIGTVHSCKGGEADHVILSPALSPAAHDQYELEGWPGHRDDTIRTMYVGMTRAKKTLWLMHEPSNLSVEWPVL
jgi:superfamily I DNA/RNA helicase